MIQRTVFYKGMAEAVKTKQRKGSSHIFTDADGHEIKFGKVDKKFRDTLKERLGVIQGEQRPSTVILDIDRPLGDVRLAPHEGAAICQACKMFTHNCKEPFMAYHGPSNPLVTLVCDSVSSREDVGGYMSSSGAASLIKKFIDAYAEETGVTSDDVRFVALTRCAHRLKVPVNYKGKANYCKIYAVQDFIDHRPNLIMPVGSVALGALCHKSNAGDWAGKLLTYRGWPDDWLTNPVFVKPREILVDSKPYTVIGHPVMGPPPGKDQRIPLFPIQAPRLVYGQQNALVEAAWKRSIIKGLKYAKSGAPPPVYDLPHYRLYRDPDEVINALKWLVDHPGTLLCFDTETGGLHPFQGQKVVFMMFRYEDDQGNPVAFGFPWDYDEDPERGDENGPAPASDLLPYLDELRPWVEAALTRSVLIGHHLTFDVLFGYCALSNMEDFIPLDDAGNIREEWRNAMARLNAIADAAKFDTWHMAYTRRQVRGSLGLEILAYDYVPELAGYEEEMTLLITLDGFRLHPDQGGHYARCPQALWESHFKPYVMGDVEVCYRARNALQEKLDNAKTYRIPIAHPTRRGVFRYFDPPSRSWLYEHIMSPAARVLMKMMGRGMSIDQKVLARLEDQMPKAITEIISEMKNVKGGMVLAYCEQKRAEQGKDWELDLDKKDVLRDILFKTLNLPIQRLTKTGRKIYGEEATEWEDKIAAFAQQADPTLDGKALEEHVQAEMLKYAALDKFTLNKLAVTYEQVRPLQDYRKAHKLYSTYVRPLNNVFNEKVDKKQREKMRHLCPDWMIHAWFLLTGTRGGRLSCRDPNLQQLPKKAFKEYNVKEMYVSRFGALGCLYGADFSQIELRIMAALSGDPSMVNAYNNDIDLHTLTASRLFGLPYETFSKEHMRELQEQGKEKEAKELSLKRDIAKTCNFLTGYGGGAFGLQNILANNQVYWAIERCEELIQLFFESYPAVRDMLSYYKKFIQERSVAVSIFGRVRVFEEAQSGDPEIASKAMRAGCNHLIQSTASDMMLICLYVIENLMREAGLESILISTVHDSLVIDALRTELPQVHEIVDTVLNNMPDFFKAVLGQDFDTSWMIVPFAGDSEVGHNYADMRSIDKVQPGCSIDWDKLLA